MFLFAAAFFNLYNSYKGKMSYIHIYLYQLHFTVFTDISILMNTQLDIPNLYSLY